jgi:uncharacterized protein YbaP (TraB family)
MASRPTDEMIQAGMENASDRGFLWRITKDGRSSFLYGTIHVGKMEWVFPGPLVKQALRATDTVALELDDTDASIQERMAKGMESLRKTVLPAMLADRIRHQADLECVSYASIAKLSPELQIEVLTMMVGRRDGLDAAYAIDAALAEIGHGSKKNVVSLETPELQLSMLQMQTPQETVAFVQDGLNEMETGRTRSLLQRIARIWAGSDYAEMSHFFEWCDCLNTEIEREVMKRALDNRNPALADSIDTLHASGKRVFAAVGSLHMFGPVGLPALMKKLGYRVEQADFIQK